jgi:hypothetical protein
MEQADSRKRISAQVRGYGDGVTYDYVNLQNTFQNPTPGEKPHQFTAVA